MSIYLRPCRGTSGNIWLSWIRCACIHFVGKTHDEHQKSKDYWQAAMVQLRLSCPWFWRIGTELPTCIYKYGKDMSQRYESAWSRHSSTQCDKDEKTCRCTRISGTVSGLLVRMRARRRKLFRVKYEVRIGENKFVVRLRSRCNKQEDAAQNI